MKHCLLWTMIVLSPITYAQSIECEYNYGKKIVIDSKNENKVHEQINNHTLIHVENTTTFSEVEDYIVLSNDKYNVTYALTCNRETK